MWGTTSEAQQWTIHYPSRAGLRVVYGLMIGLSVGMVTALALGVDLDTWARWMQSGASWLSVPLVLLVVLLSARRPSGWVRIDAGRLELLRGRTVDAFDLDDARLYVERWAPTSSHRLGSVLRIARGRRSITIAGQDFHFAAHQYAGTCKSPDVWMDERSFEGLVDALQRGL